MGILPVKKSLVQCDKLATAAFCRRRLAVVMVRAKMAETLREAVTFIEQVGEEGSGLTCAATCRGAAPGGACTPLGVWPGTVHHDSHAGPHSPHGVTL